jgi:hypothetical protein
MELKGGTKKMLRRLFALGFICTFLLLPGAALADSINPDTYSAKLNVAESVTITKTVTINTMPTSATVDIFFLTDSTLSMTEEITAVQAAASDILSETAKLGDVAWGVGEYRDRFDSFVYRTNQGLTTDAADVSEAINEWNALGGNDNPEAQFYGLQQVAETQPWRDKSTRIVVWFAGPTGDTSSESDAITALQNEHIVVQAIDVGDSTYGLDTCGDYCSIYNSVEGGAPTDGQASRIAEGTGGMYFGGINQSSIVDAIQDAITDVFQEYSEVTIDVSGVPSGVDVSITPTDYSGDYDRSTEREFTFNVTFTGATPGTYDFAIDALVDGGIVATEFDEITVAGGDAQGPAPVPEPATLLLLGAGLAGGFGFSRKKRKNK